jgi:hypothetical protein
MKINLKIWVSLLALGLGHQVMADQYSDSVNLSKEREQVIRDYILDLEKADYQGITSLFTENGSVISTSRGKVLAYDFFYSFLPSIEQANTELHQTFKSSNNSNRYAARFHFNFKLKDGEEGDGEYVDEFIFENDSTKLISVSMFENLKFNLKN